MEIGRLKPQTTYIQYICHDNLLLSVSRGNEGKQCGDNAFLVHIFFCFYGSSAI